MPAFTIKKVGEQEFQQLFSLIIALSDFEKAGREELIAKQKGELAILEDYLTQSLGEEELTRIVTEAVQASGASGQADFGKAMGAAVKAVEGRADGTMIRAIVQRLLNG